MKNYHNSFITLAPGACTQRREFQISRTNFRIKLNFDFWPTSCKCLYLQTFTAYSNFFGWVQELALRVERSLSFILTSKINRDMLCQLAAKIVIGLPSLNLDYKGLRVESEPLWFPHSQAFHSSPSSFIHKM